MVTTYTLTGRIVKEYCHHAEEDVVLTATYPTGDLRNEYYTDELKVRALATYLQAHPELNDVVWFDDEVAIAEVKPLQPTLFDVAD